MAAAGGAGAGAGAGATDSEESNAIAIFELNGVPFTASDVYHKMKDGFYENVFSISLYETGYADSIIENIFSKFNIDATADKRVEIFMDLFKTYETRDFLKNINKLDDGKINITEKEEHYTSLFEVGASNKSSVLKFMMFILGIYTYGKIYLGTKNKVLLFLDNDTYDKTPLFQRFLESVDISIIKSTFKPAVISLISDRNIKHFTRILRYYPLFISTSPVHIRDADTLYSHPLYISLICLSNLFTENSIPSFTIQKNKETKSIISYRNWNRLLFYKPLINPRDEILNIWTGALSSNFYISFKNAEDRLLNLYKLYCDKYKKNIILARTPTYIFKKNINVTRTNGFIFNINRYIDPKTYEKPITHLNSFNVSLKDNYVRFLAGLISSFSMIPKPLWDSSLLEFLEVFKIKGNIDHNLFQFDEVYLTEIIYKYSVKNNNVLIFNITNNHKVIYDLYRDIEDINFENNLGWLIQNSYLGMFFLPGLFISDFNIETKNENIKTNIRRGDELLSMNTSSRNAYIKKGGRRRKYKYLSFKKRRSKNPTRHRSHRHQRHHL